MTSAADSGSGSLREALFKANADIGADTITFNIPGNGVQTIALLTPLLQITDTLIIDGSTQPGFVLGGAPRIELNGAALGVGANGLEATAAGVQIIALTINHFSGAGILLGSSGASVVASFVGTDSDGGGIGTPGNGTGIRITGSGNTIGGTAAAARNVISDNTGVGILLTGASATGNVIVGNHIGTRPDPTILLGNGTGVLFDTGSNGNRLGGIDAGAGNVVAGNNGAGVATLGPGLLGAGNIISGNRISANTGLGIDIFNNNGVTANGPGHQAFPEITEVLIGGGRTVIRGTLTSAPSNVVAVQFFGTTQPDPSGFGEGNDFIGTTGVSTDAAGLATFAVAFDVEVFSTAFVTAVAIDAAGNTSEFSAIHTVASAAIAASISGDGRTATYTDVDGDKVTVHTSRGQFNQGDFKISAGASGGGQLQLLDLSDDASEFAGAHITVTAQRTAGGGDGFVNVGYINSTGTDLGTVRIAGDLARITVGDATLTTPGLRSLTAQSMGRYLGFTQALAPSLVSTIQGTLPRATFATDLVGVELHITGNLDSLTIGGSLVGGSAGAGGVIDVAGILGKAKIVGDISGGGATASGTLFATTIRDLTIGGSIIGGSAETSGRVFAGTGGLGKLRIADSIIGGAGAASGTIVSDGSIGSVKIGGGTNRSTGNLSGSIVATSRITSLDIGGNVFADIACLGTIGSVKVGRDFGGFLSARGTLTPTSSAEALAIGSVTVGGNLSGSIYAGYDIRTGNITNPDVQIGAITVGRNANQANISAGVSPGANLQFGDGDDMLAAGGNATVAQIASIIVKGQVGTFATGEHSGFAAQQIGKLQIGSTKFTLTTGTDRFDLGTLGNISLREV